jgi:hypothetical protein
MRKSLVVSIALILVAALSAPACGAMLDVGGKYVGSLMYDGEVAGSADSVISINPGGTTEGIDCFGMSALYLNLDFTEESLLEAHFPLILFKDVEKSEPVIASNPDDEYLLVHRGDQFTLSLTDAVEGDYAFVSLKDPLGLVREIDTDDMTVFKLTGEPWGIDVLGYLVSAVFTDKKGKASESRYGAARASYKLPQDLRLGITWGIHRKLGNNIDNVDRNISIDLNVPIPISKKATLQGALAINRGSEDRNAYGVKKALLFKVRKLELGNITLAGDFIAVEPEFIAVAHKKESSDVFDYEGKRYLRGEGKTVFDIFGYDVKTALSYERTVNSDGSFDHEKGSSKHKVSGEAEFNLSPDVTVTVDRYIDKTLADTGDYKDDYTIRTRAKMSCESPDANEVWGRLWRVEKEHKKDEGTAHKLEGGVKVKSLSNGKVEGKAGYEQGALTFPSYTSVGKYTTKLYGEIYGELERTFMPDEVDQVDILLAGIAKYSQRKSKTPETALVAYGEVDVAIHERLSNKTVLLFARESKATSHYGTTVYNRFGYKMSSNTTLALGYTFKENRCTVDVLCTVTIGNARFELGYGKTGLRDECTATGHTGKPWAWLCLAEIEPKPKLFTLTITVPF